MAKQINVVAAGGIYGGQGPGGGGGGGGLGGGVWGVGGGGARHPGRDPPAPALRA